MQDHTVQLTRKQLFDLVWSKPMTDVAKDFHLSDVSLARICRRHEVPTPPLGYWAKVKHRHRAWRPVFLQYQSSDSDAIEITIRSSEAVGSSVEVKQPFEALQMKIVSSILPTLPRMPHTLLQRASVRVTDKTANRAKQMMNTLLHLFELFGFTIDVRDGDRAGTYVSILGEDIRVRLTELLKQVDNPNMKSVFDSKHISVPTGQLCFSIEDVLGENIQARWKDTKSASLEEKYLDICEGLVEAAYRNRIWRIEREEGERLRQEQQRIREGKEAALKAEEAKKDELFRNASAWHKSQEVRSYVEAVKSSMKVSDEWINWALKQADMIDPTLSGDQKEDE